MAWAALPPPVERTLLLAKVDLAVNYDGRRYELAANETAEGLLRPGLECGRSASRLEPS
jgi:hypothetical protein